MYITNRWLPLASRDFVSLSMINEVWFYKTASKPMSNRAGVWQREREREPSHVTESIPCQKPGVKIAAW